MTADVLAVAWKEWRELLAQDEGLRSGLLRFGVLVAAGVVLEWQLGPALGRSWATLGPVAFVALLIVLTTAADTFAGERERHTLETLLASRVPTRAVLLGKVAVTVAFAWTLALVVLALGLAAVPLHPEPPSAPVDAGVVAAAAAFGLLAALLLCLIGVLISRRAPTVRQAQQRLSLAFLLVGVAPILLDDVVPGAWARRADAALRALPPSGAIVLGLVLLAVADAGLLYVATRRFRRAELVAGL